MSMLTMCNPREDLRFVLTGPFASQRAARSQFANVIWIAFVLTQIFDGVLTYVGISTLGPNVEANPVLSWYIAATGVTLAVIGAKLFALGCGAVLHLLARHGCIALLTGLYVAAALWPWAVVLWHV
ncbi:MAG: hypothetical protein C5B57_09465 [Blastocatellia bacterium]|nr:MAG: hypothetical protein C5B57_09465 [Blastocatellia bacterium]